MLGGTFRQSLGLGPLLAPCTYALHAQQLISLRQFRPNTCSTRTLAHAATMLQPTKHRKQEPEGQWAAEFRSLGLSPELLVATQEHGLTQPTEIQAAAIPDMLQGGDVLLASHTGSGKTLAYLLPLVHNLRQQEQDGQQTKPRRPRALVLGPTRELTDQILQVAKSLSHHARFRSACVNGGGTYAQQAASLATPLDILVATPQKLLQHAEKGNVYYGDVQYVVLDEADTMFDRGFGPEVEKVLGPLRSKPEPAHCILVAATLTKPIRRLLEEKFPDMKRLETKSLHKGVAGARHTFLRQTPGQNKLDLLLQVVESEQRRGQKVMIFCNTLDSCRAADKYLQEHDLPSLSYHGDVPLDGRRQAIAAFAEGGNSADGSPAAGRQSSSQPVLVCTDLAARGLDIPGQVDHVVNFDFPYNPVDYIHRTGRTARAGHKGRVTSLVAKGDQVLASRIDQALQQGLPMDELSADKKSLPPNMRPKPETLKRRFTERKASQQRGVRGAARFEPSNGQSSSSATGGRAKSAGTAKPKFGGSSTYSKTGPSSIGSSRPSKFGSGSSFGKSKPSRFEKPAGTSEDANGRPGKFGGSSRPSNFGGPSRPSKFGVSSRPSKFGGSSFGDKGKSSKFGKPSGPGGRRTGSATLGQPVGGRPGKKRGLGAHKSFK
ncbi:MAG: DEAD-box ATP-dependent RNA helicase 39-like [Trebouxia sp. A1-2]|nr:MAG: DEAD-box ATP-dependent RNA helicase 39-like [Trebouxia sp. A1-2]